MGNRITDLKALEGMAQLNSLILSQNRVIDLSPLVGAPNLSTLWLSGNQVRDVTPLKELKKLRTVLLQANRVPPEQLEELRKTIPGCRVNNKTAKK
jgi:internalin A